jgi:hypothetical protein
LEYFCSLKKAENALLFEQNADQVWPSLQIAVMHAVRDTSAKFLRIAGQKNFLRLLLTGQKFQVISIPRLRNLVLGAGLTRPVGHGSATTINETDRVKAALLRNGM